jgi:signal transduction histidine kinase
MDISALIGAREDLVLERLPEGKFLHHGELPSWCNSLRSTPLRDRVPFDVEDLFPFLSAFPDRAESAWRGEGTGRAFSEFWTELGTDGTEIHLEASAVRVGASDVLVISRNDRLFLHQQLLLQRARELRLAHSALMRELEEKDVLVHTIVHDLAAPLHSVLGALSLLEQTPQEGSNAEWIRIAVQAATRQKQMIRQILDVFAAEHGAHNAVRHSPRGGVVSVDIRATGLDVAIAVLDQGQGVPPTFVRHLFEKFGRSTDQSAGTGLGLYFCRITVERWGGAIGYSPLPRGGSNFWIQLRAAENARDGHG